MFARLKTFCVHAPEVDEKGEVIDQYFHPSSRTTTDEEKKAIIDEAKKDILEQLSKISITNPILVDDLIKLRFRIKKWFGDSS